MGTPRAGKGPKSKTPTNRFKDPADAMAFLRRRRTQEQITTICASAELGYFVARAFTWVHRNRNWLREGNYVKSPPAAPSGGLCAFMGRFTPMLSPAASLVAHGLEVFEAFERFLKAGEQLHAAAGRFYEQHPWAEKDTRLWQTELRLVCAFAMYAVEVENLRPPLSPQEMEAVALLLGIRPPVEEFEQDSTPTAKRKDAWKDMMKKVRAEVLPILRQVAAEHGPAQQDTEPLGGSTVVSGPATESAPPAPVASFRKEEGEKK